jgi:hypothetical protein
MSVDVVGQVFRAGDSVQELELGVFWKKQPETLSNTFQNY